MHGRQAHPDAALCVVACVRMLNGVFSCSAGDCLHHGLHCQVRWHLLQSNHMPTLCSHGSNHFCFLSNSFLSLKIAQQRGVLHAKFALAISPKSSRSSRLLTERLLCCRYPACSMTDVAARELATVSISDYGEDDDVTYSSRFDPWIESQSEPAVIKQQTQ